jgi:two-component system CitB family response regulator
VLIVDDDFRVAGLHAEYVDAVPGFRALPPVGTTAAALEAVRVHGPDLALVDIYLPGGSGLDFLTAIDVDAFILSAACDAASVAKALRRGALGYLVKPFTGQQLTVQLRSYQRYRRVLASATEMGQDAIDRARRLLVPADGRPTKSRAVTERSVLDVLLAAVGDLTAVEVATAVGVSRATAQRHLFGLVEEGAVAMGLRYGNTGRPEHRYSVRGRRLIAVGDRGAQAPSKGPTSTLRSSASLP